jgi:ATP-dependent DNA ligase
VVSQNQKVAGSTLEQLCSALTLAESLVGKIQKSLNEISRHYGYAGSGFSEKGLKEAIERMKPLFTVKSPFVNPPKIKEKIQWLQPKLVCEIEYAELTADEQLRQTRFLF